MPTASGGADVSLFPIKNQCPKATTKNYRGINQKKPIDTLKWNSRKHSHSPKEGWERTGINNKGEKQKINNKMTDTNPTVSILHCMLIGYSN